MRVCALKLCWRLTLWSSRGARHGALTRSTKDDIMLSASTVGKCRGLPFRHLKNPGSAMPAKIKQPEPFAALAAFYFRQFRKRCFLIGIFK